MTSILLAVALSLSTTNQYKFVNILSPSRLTASGIGTNPAQGNIPLAYTDAAFLAEAFRERASMRFSMGAKVGVGEGLSLAPACNARNLVMIYGGRINASDFIAIADTPTGILKTVARSGADAWWSLYDDNFPFFREQARSYSGQSVTIGSVTNLYADLVKLNRFGFIGGYNGAAKKHEETSVVKSGLIAGYKSYDTNPAFDYWDDYSISVTNNADYYLSYTIGIDAEKYNSVGYKWITSQNRFGEPTSPTPSSGYERRVSYYAPLSTIKCGSLPALPCGATIVSITAYALVEASSELHASNDYLEYDGGSFFVPMTCRVEGNDVFVDFGDNTGEILISNASSIIDGYKLYAPSMVMSYVPEPESPGTSRTDVGYDYNSEDAHATSSVNVADVFYIAIINFNARTL